MLSVLRWTLPLAHTAAVGLALVNTDEVNRRTTLSSKKGKVGAEEEKDSLGPDCEWWKPRPTLPHPLFAIWPFWAIWTKLGNFLAIWDTILDQTVGDGNLIPPTLPSDRHLKTTQRRKHKRWSDTRELSSVIVAIAKMEVKWGAPPRLYNQCKVAIFLFVSSK